MDLNEGEEDDEDFRVNERRRERGGVDGDAPFEDPIVN